MRGGKMAMMIGIDMIAGSVPCTLAILLFSQLMATREAVQPAGGDAIGLMMISFWACAIALLSFVSAIVYFGFAAFKNKLALRAWHWFSIAYSFSRVTIPVIYIVT